jgi:hypothetical protein
LTTFTGACSLGTCSSSSGGVSFFTTSSTGFSACWLLFFLELYSSIFFFLASRAHLSFLKNL